ncbi:MAG: pitrilysin family protein [Planctomycetota bacterium]
MDLNQEVHHETFGNGITLLCQPMPWLESAAFSFSVPAGCRFDPPGKLALANFTCEMVQRGCGEYSSREFIEALEMLGVNYSSSVSVYRSHFGGAMPAGQLLDALSIYRDVICNPHMPDAQVEDGRLVCLQELSAIQDDLGQRSIINLRQRYYGDPDGRIAEGDHDSIMSITMDDIRKFHREQYVPEGMIIAVAGKVDWQRLRDHVAELFSGFSGNSPPEQAASDPEHGVFHVPQESEQTHIAIASPGVAFSSPDYFTARAAIGALSDGMSSRLFTEVREKRGLCYTVYAYCHTLRDRGSVICYSGTSADRAQETLDVLIEQIIALSEGIYEQELARLKVQNRSGLIMQQESCSARAGSIAGDWFHLGRVRSLDEINSTINSLTVESINEYLRNNPPTEFDVVTLGPRPLTLRNGAGSKTG